MNIFELILDCRSLTAIVYKAEDALTDTQTPDARAALKRIIETNRLDEAWAIAHEQLGQREEAAKLWAWLARDKPKMSPELESLLAI